MPEPVEAPLVAVATFLTWLEDNGSGYVAAARAGCKDIRVAVRQGWKAITEDMAAQWASCFGLELEDIWADHPAKMPVQPSGMNQIDRVVAIGEIDRRPKPKPAATFERSGALARPAPQRPAGTSPEPVRPGPDMAALAEMGLHPVRPASRYAPSADPCPHCGRDDFLSKMGRGSHVRNCPKRPGADVEGDGRVPCPVAGCKAMLKAKVGLANHLHRAHPTVIPIVIDPDMPPGTAILKMTPDASTGIEDFGLLDSTRSIADPEPTGRPAGADDTHTYSILPSWSLPVGDDTAEWARDWRRRYLDLLLSWASQDGPNSELLDRIERQIAALDERQIAALDERTTP
ncbi:MAG TPA: hypothetical protein VMQ59_03425 [Acidimicrobiales bacterium]|nr:hypothetical protein [Acidimicrobiales bacterium]